MSLRTSRASSSRRSKRQSIYTDPRMLIGIIADEETTVGFLLAGIGESRSYFGRYKNYMMVDNETSTQQIEGFFVGLYSRPNLGVILIGYDVAQRISELLTKASKLTPIILEIPTKTSTCCPTIVDLIDDEEDDDDTMSVISIGS